MRGCHGRSVEESVSNYQNSQRRTNSGEFADDWRARGEAVGERMRVHKKDGKCEKCSFYGKRKLSCKREAEFRRTWGESSQSVAPMECSVNVDNFWDTCPYEVEKETKS